MKSVECGVAEPHRPGGEELAIILVEFSDERILEDSADLPIRVNGHIMEPRRRFSRLIGGQIPLEIPANTFPLCHGSVQRFRFAMPLDGFGIPRPCWPRLSFPPQKEQVHGAPAHNGRKRPAIVPARTIPRPRPPSLAAVN